MLDVLIHENRVSVADVFDQNGRTALHYAVIGGHVYTVCKLIDVCPSVIDQADNDGWTPLGIAVATSKYDIVAELLNEGQLATKQKYVRASMGLEKLDRPYVWATENKLKRIAELAWQKKQMI